MVKSVSLHKQNNLNCKVNNSKSKSLSDCSILELPNLPGYQLNRLIKKKRLKISWYILLVCKSMYKLHFYWQNLLLIYHLHSNNIWAKLGWSIFSQSMPQAMCQTNWKLWSVNYYMYTCFWLKIGSIMYSSIMYYILLYFNFCQKITLGDTDFRTESHKYSKFDM